MLRVLQTTVKKLRAIKLNSSLNSSLCSKPGDFKTIYRFPYIVQIGLVNRLKLYQTVLSAVALPATIALNQLNILGTDEILLTATLSLGGMIPLYIGGYFANKLVGFVYINEREHLVRIAYLDFWGRRKNIELQASDIIPFSELSPSITNPLYLKLRRYSDPEKLKICIKYGILDYNSFNKTFSS